MSLLIGKKVSSSCKQSDKKSPQMLKTYQLIHSTKNKVLAVTTEKLEVFCDPLEMKNNRSMQ